MYRGHTRQLFHEVERRARADGKGDYFRLHRYRYAAILKALAGAPGGRVLEIGVTPGHFTRLLVQSGYHVSGVDLDPLSRQALWKELGVDVCRMNVERAALPFANATFDRVVFSEVIEHLLFSPVPVLRECYRVLKPGGRIIITTPNELYVKSRLRALFRMLLWQSLDTQEEFQHKMLLEGESRYTTHSRTYTMHELCWLVEQAGFCVVKQHYEITWERVGLEIHRIFSRPHGVLAKGALTALTTAIPPLRSMLLVVGEKDYEE